MSKRDLKLACDRNVIEPEEAQLVDVFIHALVEWVWEFPALHIVAGLPLCLLDKVFEPGFIFGRGMGVLLKVRFWVYFRGKAAFLAPNIIFVPKRVGLPIVVKFRLVRDRTIGRATTKR